jgi:hypothetical protein
MNEEKKTKDSDASRLKGRAGCDDVEITKRFHIISPVSRCVLALSAGFRCKADSSVRYTTLAASMKPTGERCSLP